MSDPYDASGFSTLPTLGPRSTFSENLNAAYDQAYRNDSFLGLESEVQSRWEDTVKKYNARIGKDSGAAVDLRTLSDLTSFDKSKEQSWQEVFLGSGGQSEFPEQAAAAKERTAQVNEELKRLNDPSLPSLEQIMQQAVKARGEVDQRVEQVSETSGFAGTLGRFVGGVEGSFSLRDPVQLGTLFAGGFGRTVAMRIGTEMAVNAAAEGAIVSQTINPRRQALGEPEQSVFTSALVAGLGAGVLRGGAEGLGVLARHTLAKASIGELNLDFRDEQLASMFRVAPESPDARAGLHLVEGQQLFDHANPYGETEVGMRRFTGEVTDIYSASNGKTDTAVARFMQPEPFTLDNIDFELQVVREQQPELYGVLEQATARLHEIDQAIANRTGELDNVSVADGVRRIDEPSADLVADYERTALDTSKPMPVREDAARKMDMIVKSLGEEEVGKAVNDAGIGPRKELQQLRASRKAAAKQFKQVRSVVDQVVARVKQEAVIKSLALGSPVPTALERASTDVPFHTHTQRFDVVEARTQAVDSAVEHLDKNPPPVDETVDGDVDLGNGHVIPKDFQFTDPDNPEKTISARAYFNSIKNDEAMLDAMKGCAI